MQYFFKHPVFEQVHFIFDVNEFILLLINEEPLSINCEELLIICGGLLCGLIS